MLTEHEIQENWMPSYDDLHDPNGQISKGKALVPIKVLKALCDLALIGLKSSTKTLPLAKAPTDCTKSPEFMQFWNKWPKRQGRQDAWKAWNTVRPPLEAVLEALNWQCRQEGWTKDSGAFIPLPATWLRGMRWQDEKPGVAWIREEAKVKHVHAYIKFLNTNDADNLQLMECSCGDRQWLPSKEIQ